MTTTRFRVCALVFVCSAFALIAGPAASSSTPLYGTPQNIPGTIAAADFDNGGPGIAYGDTTPGNTGGAYRQTDVDLEPSSEGGYDVGWIDAGEWMNYTVSVAAGGNYTALLRVAAPGAGGRLHLGFNGPSNVWESIAIPATGGWQNWTSVSVPVTLGAGTQQMTLLFDTPGFNIRSIAVSSGSPGSGDGAGPYGGTPISLPGTIQAPNFDEGGQGVSYGDTTPGNTGGAYRQSDVDIEPSAEGGYDVGWIAAGEWLNYTVNVPAAGTYTVAARIASPNGGATMHLGFNGPSSVWQALSVPSTGGWQSWTTIATTATLGAGLQQLTFYADTGGFNLESIAVTQESGSPGVPAFSHVYVVIMENHELSSIIGNADAPYINALASQYGSSTAYTAVAHPSLPNYMALTSGQTAFSDDCIGCVVDTTNIGDIVEGAGRTWKAYMEDMPSPCATADSGLYATKHDPFVHYVDIVSNGPRCAAHVVPLTRFYDDLNAGALPSFAWVTPNLCSDMHDCDVATGDRWLSAFVPQVLSAPDFQNSVLFILWDEGTTGTDGGGVVPLIVVSPQVVRGVQTAPANHYNLLRTITDGLHLPALGAAAGARPLTEFFAR